ncbi:U6 snRNA-associated Sm-like protein LSm7 [Ochotona princeps]|uniref:U6 snRNA-associated Sm-like protein LSm7 n=1 Tax=Ochotona princeps TaxID=9978 RepID=UPI002714A204|nr:U6 snRNA-associated Sm-like protein LSm7 [Ochotona princeps]
MATNSQGHLAGKMAAKDRALGMSQGSSHVVQYSAECTIVTAIQNWEDGGEPTRAAGRVGAHEGGGPASSRSWLSPQDKEKKESILDLSKYIDKTIHVKFQGGREASGVLKGFNPLLNLVLDVTIEHMRDPDNQYRLTEDTRQLGLVVCWGTSVMLICPQDGMEAIPNPFVRQQDT